MPIIHGPGMGYYETDVPHANCSNMDASKYVLFKNQFCASCISTSKPLITGTLLDKDCFRRRSDTCVSPYSYSILLNIEWNQLFQSMYIDNKIDKGKDNKTDSRKQIAALTIKKTVRKILTMWL